MMSQRALASLFGDDLFFGGERLLWPRSRLAASSPQHHFFRGRATLANSLLRELHDEPPLLRLRPLPLISSMLARLSGDTEQQVEAPGTQLRPDRLPLTHSNNSDLLVTLDARGYAPSDITVKLEGRSLAVVAMKQTGTEGSQACSSSSSHTSCHPSVLSQTGFVQKIDLPAHLDLSGLSCSLMDDGQLQIHAPAARQPTTAEEQPVPIRFRTSLEVLLNKDPEEKDQLKENVFTHLH